MLKKIIKNIFFVLFKLFSKEYLIEYWAIIRNEKNVIDNLKKTYSEFIKPNWVIFDVGANIGNYSKVFIDLGAKVYAFEPQKYCKNILKKRFKKNAKFILIGSAVGSLVSKGVLHRSDTHTIASMDSAWISKVNNSKRFGKKNWNKKEEVEITTLDMQIKKLPFPNYIKIDVEGFEYNVLKGLNTSVPFISFEITLPEMYDQALECIVEISKLGNYSFFISKTDKIVDNIWLQKEEIIKEIAQLVKIKKQISTDVFAKQNY